MGKILNKNINTAEHYNEIFGNRNFDIDYQEPLRAKAMMEKFTSGKFLDLGCGVATHCQLARTIPGAEVYGMDFSDKLIESLKSRFKGINYSVGDVRDLKFGDESFDYIVLGEVLEHTDNPITIIRGIMRILKKGGVLAISTPEDDGGGFSCEEHVWTFNKEELTNILKQFGEVEVSVLLERGHRFLIAYLTK